ncbi:MAG: hypothetical protein HJJLKODD_00783 [Phycisphaerae bacterium]|nr:hypothetical protein [Phycisphaerae bacterium]
MLPIRRRAGYWCALLVGLSFGPSVQAQTPCTSVETNLLATDQAGSYDEFGNALQIEEETMIVGAQSDSSDRGSAYLYRRGGEYALQSNVVAPNPNSYDYFGAAVAVNGNTMVVGAYQDDVTYSNSGTVYVFEKVVNQWEFRTQFQAAQPQSSENFGYSVAIQGNTIVVGAPGYNSSRGAVYVFDWNGTQWVQTIRLTASDGASSDKLGWAVAFDGTWIAAGAPLNNTASFSDNGSVYLYEKAPTWTQRAQIVASDAQSYDEFGSAVAISGGTVVVGAYKDDLPSKVDAGSAYVFTGSGSSWTQQAQLNSSDIAAGDYFGSAVAIHQNRIMIGAYKDDLPSKADAGSVYVFSNEGGSWSQQAQLTATDSAAYDYFGYAVAMNVWGAAVVGAYGEDQEGSEAGAAYLFQYNGSSWVQRTKFLDANLTTGDNFGYAVDISSDTVAIGAWKDDTTGGYDGGSAYVFRPTGEWIEQRIVASDGLGGDGFGTAVAISGDWAVVGAPTDDYTNPSLTDAGAAYVYQYNGLTWTQVAKLTPADLASYDYFGQAVAIWSNVIAVSSYKDDDNGKNDSGSVYLFIWNGSSWVQSTKFTAGTDAQISEYFGYSLAMRDGLIAVGAYGANSQRGAAYVFNTAGAKIARVVASDGASSDEFGYSVGISESSMIVGAPYDNLSGGSDQGSAYVYVGSGGTWTQQQKLSAADYLASDHFGWSVAIIQNYAIVGSPDDDHFQNGAGSAYLYLRNGSTWSQRARLYNSTATSSDDGLGIAVSISAELAVAGAYKYETSGTDRGEVYIFYNQPDADGDTALDYCDNCPSSPSGQHIDTVGCADSQVDMDSDLVCDPGAPGVGPSGCSGSDNCVSQANPDQQDEDIDGVGDVCDVCPIGPDIDADGDMVADGCDNCVGDVNPGQQDADGDGLGDVCDYSLAQQMNKVRDGNNNILETLEYSGGKLNIRYQGTAGSHIARTNYYYSGALLTQMVTTPTDGSGAARTIDLVYDPNHPTRVIGTLHGGCGCGSGQSFTYRDDAGRVVRVTTADLPPGSATVLDEYDFVSATDNRLLEHRQRNFQGQLVPVEKFSYTDHPEGTYDVLIRRRIDSQWEQVSRESYDATGRQVAMGEYEDLLPAGAAVPPVADFVTTFNHQATVTGGHLTYEEHETISPSGVRQVIEKRLYGTPYAQNSYWDVQQYITDRADPADTFKRNWHRERLTYSTTYRDYQLTRTTFASGKTVDYVYYTANPGRLYTETHSAPGGISSVGTMTITYTYDAAGRVQRVTQPTTAGSVVRFYEYDTHGRKIRQVEDEGGLNLRLEYRYNAFDELLLSRNSANLVHANIYDAEGQVTEQYSCEYTGALDSFNPQSPPGLLQQSKKFYHDSSGQLTEEWTAVTETLPFSRNSAPFAVKSHDYDSTGVWKLATTDPGIATPMVYIYDDQGRLVSEVSAEGVAHTSVYDGRGLVRHQVTGELGLDYLMVENIYNSDGQIELVANPDGTYEYSEYDVYGRLEMQQRCDQENCSGETIDTHYEYTDAGQERRRYVVGISDVTRDYDYWGRAYRTRQRATLGGNDDNHADGISDRVQLVEFDIAGNQKRVAIKIDGNPGAIVEGVDLVTKFTYDKLNKPLTVVQVNYTPQEGQFEERMRLVYDAAGRVQQQIMAEGSLNLATRYSYDVLDRLTKEIDPEGHYSDQFYDSRGQIIRQVHYEDGDGDGLVGWARLQQRYHYDVTNRLSWMAVMQSAVAGPGTVPNAALDQLVMYTYDDDHRDLTQTTYHMHSATPLVTQKHYDPIGRLDRITDAAGNSTEVVYEPFTGRVDYRVLHDIGNLQRRRTIDLIYDSLSRVQQVVDRGESGSAPLTTQFYHDDADRVFRRIDANNTETRFSFDLLGQLKITTEDYGGMNRITRLNYDRAGRRSALIANDGTADQTTSYTYDLVNRPLTTRYPDEQPSGAAVVLDYDQAGRLVQRTDPRNVVVTYDYDRRGLLENRSSGSGSSNITDHYEYDGLGRLQLARRTVGATQISESIMTYNDLNQLESESQKLFSAAPKLLNYDYDQAGNRTALDCPAQLSECLSFDYDSLDRVNQIDRGAGGQVLADYDYNGLYLRQRSVTTSAGARVNYLEHYDAHRRLDQISNQRIPAGGGPAQILAQFDYPVFDGVGNLLATDESGNPIHNDQIDYELNPLEQLETAFYNAGEEHFNIDLLGNRNQYQDTRNAQTINYQPNTAANEYTRINNQLLTMDRIGNVTIDERGYRYVYDFQNRLIKVQKPRFLEWSEYGRIELENGDPASQFLQPYPLVAQELLPITVTIADFDYDALGRRIRERRYNTSGLLLSDIRYYYEGDRVLAEYSASGQRLRYYVNGATYVDEHILISVPGTLLYDQQAQEYAVELDKGEPMPMIPGVSAVQNDSTALEGDPEDRQEFSGDDLTSLSPPMDLDYQDAQPMYNQEYYYLHQEQFSVAGLANAQGQIRELYDYDAYGAVKIYNQAYQLLAASAISNMFGFTGQPLDRLDQNQLDLYHYRRRTYQPLHGRFQQRDPAGYVDSGNLYEYVRGNPRNLADPTGRVVILIHGVNDPGAAWMNGAESSLIKYWKDKGECEQAVIKFKWGVPRQDQSYSSNVFWWSRENSGQGGLPWYATDDVNTTRSGGWTEYERQYMTEAVNRLKWVIDVLNQLRQDLKSQEPITVIAHSQGTILTLRALQEGAEIDNLIMMGSPLDIWQSGWWGTSYTPDNDLIKAKEHIRGKVFNYWSNGDEWAGFKGGIGANGNDVANQKELDWINNREFGPGKEVNGYPLPTKADWAWRKLGYDDYDHGDYLDANFFYNIHAKDVRRAWDNTVSMNEQQMKIIKAQALGGWK